MYKITNIIEDEINYHPEFVPEFNQLIYTANSHRCDSLVYFYATGKKELVVAIDPYASGLLGCAAYSCNCPDCTHILLGRLPRKVKAKLMNYLSIIGQELEHLGFTLLTPIKPNPYYYTTCTAKVIPPSN